MLDDELKQCIQHAYRRFLEGKGVRARYSQRQMIADIANTLASIKSDDEGVRTGDKHVCVIEAGTGTGKTVAYALAAIPVAQALGKTLVISTATVALQEQLIYRDLPDILRHSGLEFTFTLAKGRGRYLCSHKLDNHLSGQQSGVTLSLWDDEQTQQDEMTLQLYRELHSAYSNGKWDGDRDNWSATIEESRWRSITTDHVQCTGRRCSAYHQCCFFKARIELTKVDCIVANHDLVLSDLNLGGGVVLPNPAATLYVFDEGHHLPDKALNHFTHFSQLKSSEKWLDRLGSAVENMTKALHASQKITRYLQKYQPLHKEINTALGHLYMLCEEIAQFPNPLRHQSGDLQYRFEKGVVPEPLAELADSLKKLFARFCTLFDQLQQALKEALDNPTEQLPVIEVEKWLPLVGATASRGEANLLLWSRYADAAKPATKSTSAKKNQPPIARWLSLIDSGGNFDIEVSSSPVLADRSLQQCLWDTCYGAVVTSATLTALGHFERYKMRSGVPADALFHALPSPFDYAASGAVVVPAMSSDPSNAAAHTDEIIQLLPSIITEPRAALVLFSSWRQMNDVYQGLPEAWQHSILLQGAYSKQEVMRRHCEQIDNGENSVLFGVASFSEGVDLPGKYCNHVVIAKIPFAVPNHPVEATLAEWIEGNGGNPFMEITVPDAALRLVQACGRLIRTEQDRGTITLLDRRLVTRRYGKQLLDSLPPFRREIG